MPVRDRSATIQLSKIRMKEEMRTKLAEEAKARGITLNAVIVDRLSQSLANDVVLGGNITRVMGNAFYLNGQIAAQYEGHPDWQPADWIKDPACFETATLATVKVLWLMHPAPDRVVWAWREWAKRLAGYLAGLYAPADATREQLTVSPDLGEVEAGRRDRKEMVERRAARETV